jgi:CO dehydrogenase maturation factor
LRTVVTGKGGVGKTTLVSCLAAVMARGGSRVLAVDADPQMNLARALGLDREAAARIVPLSDNADYVEEKTGVRPGPGSMGSLFKLNPDVDDVVERFGMKLKPGLGLLVMGTVRRAGGGCLCAENVLLESVIGRLGLESDDLVLLDTQAGMEHFGRGLARGFDRCLVVTDSTLNAFTVACRSAALARQSGILDVTLLVNRSGPSLEQKLGKLFAEAGEPIEHLFEAVVLLPEEPRLADLDPDVTAILLDEGSPYAAAISALAQRLRPRDCGCTARRAAAAVEGGHLHDPAHGHAHPHDHGPGHDHDHPGDHGHRHDHRSQLERGRT